MDLIASTPLFRDPTYDGAADRTVIWNRQEQAWWLPSGKDWLSIAHRMQNTVSVKRTSIQFAELELNDNLLVCDRDKPFDFTLHPET